MIAASNDPAAALRQASDWARSGQLQRASALCAEVLRRHTDHAEAWLLHAAIAMQAGDVAVAAASALRSIEANPARSAAHVLRGEALLVSKRPQDALESFEAALRRDAGSVSAHFGRGNALLDLKRPNEAVQSYEEVLRHQPRDSEALFNRGVALFELEQFAAAVESYDRAIAARPSYAAALNNRGAALLSLRKPEAALASFDAALAIKPGFPETLYHRGVALVGRGEVLRDLGRHAEAVCAYDEALRLAPDRAGVHCHRAHALMQCDGRIDEALESYSRALELDPGTPYASGSLFHARSARADWRGMPPEASRETIVRSVLGGQPVCAPFAFLSITDSAAAQLQCARSFLRESRPTDSRRSRRYRHERIRVAYVSADLRDHAVTHLLVGALERHDRGRFETYGVSLRPAERSAVGIRIKDAFDRFIDASDSSDREVAELMRSLEVDIAVDLTGYTQGFRPEIFALGAAPIQVNYLGYPGTMGAPFIDYLIADEFVIPPGKREYYREAIVYLPECFQANDDRRPISEREVSRAREGLPEDAFVFCSSNNTHKLNPPMFDIWMRLLGLVPGSVLWLLGPAAAAVDNLRGEATARGIDATRLVFAERVPYAEHLGRLKLSDLALDTLPFNAGATASDALWAGVPLLTCAGEAFAGRMAGSLLRTAGIPEMVTFSAEEYERKALELAQSPDLLRSLRRRLAENRTTAPLFDTLRFTRHLEAAYAEMWRRHECGLDPSGFAIPSANRSRRP
jgi:protein O-GlcNAc transferase